MDALDKKINEHFSGKVVRKDLTKLVKGNAIVPTYVLEFLLGQYCATDDPETIKEGVEMVKKIISKHFVHRDEAELIKATIRDKGNHRIIDKVSVVLNDKKDQYEASFANLGLNKIPIADSIIRDNKKLLSSGVWCILTLGYFSTAEKDWVPWVVEKLKLIQVSNADVSEYKETRKSFSRNEWIDLLLQTIGLNPNEFTFRSKLIQLTRLVPFVENNYNLIELGPKGTGKSHIFSELSPHGMLISGGEVSKAKLFVNNSNGNIGLVGYWDVVAYDEFAGKSKRTDRGLVDIMKNYMANQSFSRGTQIYGASASMVFVGNTDRSVPFMIKQSNLFDALPKDYYDTAFLDRLHAYIPGWEVQKLRNEMFTNNYGFIVDYLAEILKELRKEDLTNTYSKYFELSNSITTRDKTSIGKTYAGLVKVIYPNNDLEEAEAQELLEFAIENRKRVQLQLRKMDETFEEVDFSYTIKSTGKKISVDTLEVVQFGSSVVVHPEPNSENTNPFIEIPAVAEVVEIAEKTAKKPPLEEGQKIIRDNQIGVSYENLLGDYLEGVTEITLMDPYIRHSHQIKNFMEFVKLIAKKKDPDAELKLHLITANDPEYIPNAKIGFDKMYYNFTALEIYFSYEFKEKIHDRYIQMDNGWKILLGRGLDIWQKTGGPFDINEYLQEQRYCKSNEVTFIKLKTE